MSKMKFKWNSEKILSISALFISFTTLIIFVYQTNLMRKQNYTSIMPYLELSITNDNEGNTFTLSLDNHGIGPAIIESVIMDYKDEEYNLSDFEDHLYSFLSSMEPVLDSINTISFSTLDVGMAIPANSQYPVLSVKNSKEGYQLITSTINRMLEEGWRYEIIYKSIQNERWVIHNDTQGPKKLR